ncbi:hypothetical protein L596_003137 [Steinernema carpocapsae]|uniref:Uncharacterized protein n=1 Tax=Steinernema carpocapsae TaxID=34508 RepID=A0A4U8UT70_STECR|nr:hypothetical protein L596_003137 [Steinernema carpocapsae]
MAVAQTATLASTVRFALLTFLALLSGSSMAASWSNGYPNPDPTFISLNENITFYANETKVFFRTDSFRLKTSECLEYYYRLKGKRTRLYVYTCRLSHGGRCVFHKYHETDGDLRCHYLSPWMRSQDEYAFFFHFERRPRNFRDDIKKQRYLRRLRRQKSFPVVGEVELHGLKSRREICRIDYD